MNKNEFELVFQYDEEQAGNRRTDNRVKKLIETNGGTYNDVFETYGLIDINCSFVGTPEQVLKLGKEILLASHQYNVKMIQEIRQKYYIITIESQSSNEVLIQNLKTFIQHNFLGKITTDEHLPNNLQIRFNSKNDLNLLKNELIKIIQEHSPQANIFEDSDNIVIASNNNYSKDKKTTLI